MKIKWREKGFYELRSEPGVVADLEKRGAAISNAAGDGFEMGSQQGKRAPQGRWRVGVVTATVDAMKRSANEDALLRALDAGR